MDVERATGHPESSAHGAPRGPNGRPRRPRTLPVLVSRLTRSAQASASPSENRTLDSFRRPADPGREIEVSSSVIRMPACFAASIRAMPHRVRVVVRRAVRLMVQVVELAHAGDAAGGHLAVGGQGQFEVGVGIEPPGDGVHLLAPGPERPTFPLGPPAQGAVERVAVTVREPRNRQAWQPFRRRRPRLPDSHAR